MAPASGEIPPSSTEPSCFAISSMQRNNPSRPVKSIFFTRDKSTTTQGLSVASLFFSSRLSSRASFTPKTSGSLIMIAAGISISPSSGSSKICVDLKSRHDVIFWWRLPSLKMPNLDNRLTQDELLTWYPLPQTLRPAVLARSWLCRADGDRQLLPPHCGQDGKAYCG